MDVVKVVTLILSCALISACSQKKTAESVTASANQCPQNKMENRFIVQWEDGTFSVEQGENMDEFRETFVKENLEQIKHVDHDHIVKLHKEVTPTVEESSTVTVMTDEMNWGPRVTQASALWSAGVTGDGVIVAVIDGMVDTTHPQLIPNLAVNSGEIPNNGKDDDGNGFVDDVYGIQVNNEKNDPYLNVHGSHVAGIIAADPTKGPVQGMAPKAKILPAQFISNQGDGSLGDAIIAMNYAASRGAKILNMSWGGAACVPENLLAAMQKLSAQGILLVTAAGNGDRYHRGIDMDVYPDYPSAFNLANQINVAATTIDDFMVSFSNYGLNKVHVAAPGVDIYSTVPMNGIEKMSGTSMAAPMVSGAAALLWSAYPTASSQQIKQALFRGVDQRSLSVSTHGRINVNKSLSELKKILGL